MFSKREVGKLFTALNAALESNSVRGELYLVGGAVMCLVYEARPATKDIDAIFRPIGKVREAAKRVALERGISENWLNDAVKGYLSPNQSSESYFSDYLDLSHLKVLCARPEYLLAMKCLAMRIGEEFHDLSDIRFLLRLLNIESYDQALKIISTFYPIDRFPQKTLYALEELLSF